MGWCCQWWCFQVGSDGSSSWDIPSPKGRAASTPWPEPEHGPEAAVLHVQHDLCLIPEP